MVVWLAETDATGIGFTVTVSPAGSGKFGGLAGANGALCSSYPNNRRRSYNYHGRGRTSTASGIGSGYGIGGGSAWVNRIGVGGLGGIVPRVASAAGS